MTIQDSAIPEKLEGAALVDSLKKKIGTAALAGLLVPLGVAGSASEAEAGLQEPPIFETTRRSHVESDVTQQPGGEFLYEFTVFNTSILGYDDRAAPVIVDWELPLFSLNGIDVQSIQSPENWAFEVIDIDGNIVIDQFGNTSGQSLFYNNDNSPYGEYAWDWTAADDPVFNDPDANPDGLLYGPDPDQFETPDLILHWYTLDGGEGFPLNPIFPFEPFNSLSGFSFLAADSAVNAPYQASWFQEPQTIGDPPIPQGAAIGVPNNAQVSEPGILALFATGLLGLLGLRRRRNSA